MSLRGRKVLLTGDSHMEWSQFGRQLSERLRGLGAQVVNLSIGGSSARSWTRGEPVCRTIGGERRCLTVADLRAQGPYDIAVIGLGTNDAANAHAEGADADQAAARTAERVGELVRQIGASQTWVVGPPRMGRQSGHYTDATMAPVSAALARAFGPWFIDSREFGHLDGDGVHVGRAGGRAWTELVSRRITARSAALVSATASSWVLPVALAGVAALGLGALGWWALRPR